VAEIEQKNSNMWNIYFSSS